MPTPSVFPMFLKASAVVVGGTIIVGGLGVGVADSVGVLIESQISVADVSEILVPVDAAFITVTVEAEHTVSIETC